MNMTLSSLLMTWAGLSLFSIGAAWFISKRKWGWAAVYICVLFLVALAFLLVDFRLPSLRSMELHL